MGVQGKLNSLSSSHGEFYSYKHCPSLGSTCAKLLQLCPTLCDPVDCSPQAPLRMGFSREEYCSGLPFPPPEDLPSLGIESESLLSPALAGGSLPPVLPGWTWPDFYAWYVLVILCRPFWKNVFGQGGCIAGMISEGAGNWKSWLKAFSAARVLSPSLVGHLESSSNVHRWDVCVSRTIANNMEKIDE